MPKLPDMDWPAGAAEAERRRIAYAFWPITPSSGPSYTGGVVP